MGWMCSWAAVQGADKDEVLAALDLVETGEEVEPGSRRKGLCCTEFAGGWFILFSEDFGWADRDRVLDLSRFGLTVGCQFEDKVEMESIARAARDGVELWLVSHANDEKRRLEVSGEPPEAFAAIRDGLFKEQEENGGEDAPADFLHDIPLEVAKAACGYRADDYIPAFMGLRGAGETAGPRPGFFARLFGKGR